MIYCKWSLPNLPLSAKFKDILYNYYQALTFSSTPLVKCRLILSLGYYFEALAADASDDKKKEMLPNYIQFTCGCIKVTDKNPECVSNMAVLSVKMLLKNKSTRAIIDEMKDNIIKAIIETIPDVATHELFDILRFIFT